MYCPKTERQQRFIAINDEQLLVMLGQSVLQEAKTRIDSADIANEVSR